MNLYLLKRKNYFVVNKGFIIQLLLGFVSFCIYTYFPLQMPMSKVLFYIAFAWALLSLVIFFFYKKKVNYFDFDTIFIFMAYIVHFLSPFFYDESYYRLLFLGFDFDTTFINSATWIAVLGMQAYFCGSLYGINNSYKVNLDKNNRLLSTKILGCIVTVLILLFIISGGLEAYRELYTGEGDFGGIYTYFLLLIIVVSIIIESIEIHNKKLSNKYHFRKYPLFLISIFCLLLLSVGNRTAFSQLCLPLLGLYCLLFKPVKLKIFIVLMFLGIFSMWIIQNNRAKQDINMGEVNYVMLFTDLTIPSRTLYVGMEYVEKNGYTYGKSMMAGILGVIPKLPSLFSDSIREMGSAELITNYTYDSLGSFSERRTGLGTTIIADIYLSFGTWGVVCLMFFLGRFVYIHQRRANSNVYSLIILAAMLANSVFLVRASYTHTIRYILWSLFFTYLYVRCFKLNNKNLGK